VDGRDESVRPGKRFNRRDPFRSVFFFNWPDALQLVIEHDTTFVRLKSIGDVPVEYVHDAEAGVVRRGAQSISAGMLKIRHSTRSSVVPRDARLQAYAARSSLDPSAGGRSAWRY
jgi:hypothetical protein